MFKCLMQLNYNRCISFHTFLCNVSLHNDSNLSLYLVMLSGGGIKKLGLHEKARYPDSGNLLQDKFWQVKEEWGLRIWLLNLLIV